MNAQRHRTLEILTSNFNGILLAGSIEVYHNVTLKYAPKRLHFTYDSMRARTELAIIDHNMNVGRLQKTTKDGKESSIFSIFRMQYIHSTFN